MQNSQTNGFTLPVVLLISISVLIVGLTALQTVASVRDSFDMQYYNRLASEAAEAGAVRATYCLKMNNYQQTWGPAKGKPALTQATNCSGDQNTAALSSIIRGSNMKISFEINDLEVRSDGAVLVAAQGKIERYRGASTTVFQTYNSTTKKSVKPPDVQLGRVTFGYWDESGGGAYFAVYGSNGDFYTAGSNFYGNLGDGTTTNRLEPQRYLLPAGKIANKAYSNFLSQGYQLYVQTTSGELYGSGKGQYGELGNGSYTTNNSTPQKFQLPGSEKAVYVGVNGNATYVLTDANNLYAAGSCSFGKLGTGCPVANNNATPARVSLPTPNINDLNTIPEYDIQTDASTTFIRMKGGRVYGWGRNHAGQLGDNTSTDAQTPKKIGTFGDSGQPKAVSLGFDGATLYVIDSNGKAWSTGRNDYGQTGYNPATNPYRVLQQVPIPAAAGKVLQVHSDQWFAAFRTESGDVYSLGLGDRGQLGNSTNNGATAQQNFVPQKFILPSGVKAVDVWTSSLGTDFSQNYNNTFVLGSDGKVYGAGANTYGQLGIGAFDSKRSTPVAMQIIDGVSLKATNVISGFGTSVVMTDSNRIFTVGNNNYGQLGLGNGSTANTNVPAEAKFLKSATPTYIF